MSKWWLCYGIWHASSLWAKSDQLLPPLMHTGHHISFLFGSSFLQQETFYYHNHDLSFINIYQNAAYSLVWTFLYDYTLPYSHNWGYAFGTGLELSTRYLNHNREFQNLFGFQLPPVRISFWYLHSSWEFKGSCEMGLIWYPQNSVENYRGDAIFKFPILSYYIRFRQQNAWEIRPQKFLLIGFSEEYRTRSWSQYSSGQYSGYQIHLEIGLKWVFFEPQELL